MFIFQRSLSRVAATAVSLGLGGISFAAAQPAHPVRPAPKESPCCASSVEPACKPIIVCGPSGAGKSTLIARLVKEFPDDFGFSVSHTTRPPRGLGAGSAAGMEVNGVHYFFVDKDTMTREIEEGKFLEHALVHGNYYGTSKQAVDSVSAKRRVCILDIDIQGVKSCKRLNLDVGSYIFIAPPDMETLSRRLRGRGTETEDRVVKRLATATTELDNARWMSWDAWIVNDDVDAAYAQLKKQVLLGREHCAQLRRAEAAAAAAGPKPPAAPATTARG